MYRAYLGDARRRYLKVAGFGCHPERALFSPSSFFPTGKSDTRVKLKITVGSKKEHNRWRCSASVLTCRHHAERFLSWDLACGTPVNFSEMCVCISLKKVNAAVKVTLFDNISTQNCHGIVKWQLYVVRSFTVSTAPYILL